MMIKIKSMAAVAAGLMAVALFLVGCGNQASNAIGQTTNQASNANGQTTNPAPKSSSGTKAAPTNEVDPAYGHLTHAQRKLPTIKVWLGSEELTAEMALRPIEIATGMMFRTNMLENEAMIFVFGAAAPRSFYMRNCTVPLTAAYINPDGVIEEFAKLDPGNTNGVPSRSWNIQYVLELPQGWHERHNIRTGAVVRTSLGTLRETFFKR